MGQRTKTWAAAAFAVGFILWGGREAGRAAFAAEPKAESPAGAGTAVIPYKTLTWDDFRVDDSIQGLAAETGTSLSFRYQMQVENAAKNAASTPGETFAYTAHISSITFSGGFDRIHSWRRSKVELHPDAARLLLHEQGHLDIAESGRRRLETIPLSALPEGRGPTINDAVTDLKAHMAVWFQAESARIKIRQLQYDMETEFSTKKNKQQAWNDLLTREMLETAPNTVTIAEAK